MISGLVQIFISAIENLKSGRIQNWNLDASRFFIFNWKIKIWTCPDIDSRLRILTCTSDLIWPGPIFRWWSKKGPGSIAWYFYLGCPSCRYGHTIKISGYLSLWFDDLAWHHTNYLESDSTNRILVKFYRIPLCHSNLCWKWKNFKNIDDPKNLGNLDMKLISHTF